MMFGFGLGFVISGIGGVVLGLVCFRIEVSLYHIRVGALL